MIWGGTPRQGKKKRGDRSAPHTNVSVNLLIEFQILNYYIEFIIPNFKFICKNFNLYNKKNIFLRNSDFTKLKLYLDL